MKTSTFIRHKPLIKSRGIVAVEFALVLIPLLLIVGGIIEFGRAFWYYDALAKASRDAARYLSDAKPLDLAAASALAEEEVTAARVPSHTITISCSPNPDCTTETPEYVKVTILHTFRPFVRWTPGPQPMVIPQPSGGLPLRAETTMRYMRGG